MFSARGASHGNQIHVASEWLVSVLEIFTRAGLIPIVRDDRLQAAVGALTRQPRRSSDASTWRLGLVGDYLQRTTATRPLVEGDSGLAHTIAEYIALVDEFQASPAGHAFLQMASPLEGVGASRELEQLRHQWQAIYRRTGVASPEVVDGAAEFMALIENCHSLLTTLERKPEVRSACWRFHGSLFTRRQVFQFALSLLYGDEQRLNPTGLLVYRIPIGHASLAGPLRAAEDRAARLQHLWGELSRPQRWTGNETIVLNWDGMVRLARSPTGWYAQTGAAAG